MDESEPAGLDNAPEVAESEPKKEIYQWKEITKDFFQSVEELELGELLHYEMFGLFEAMSAIEMMDKKMDIGMVDGKEKVPLTLDVAVQVCRSLATSNWILTNLSF